MTTTVGDWQQVSASRTLRLSSGKNRGSDVSVSTIKKQGLARRLQGGVQDTLPEIQNRKLHRRNSKKEEQHNGGGERKVTLRILNGDHFALAN